MTGADAAPLGERVIKAFADILEAPGGLLLATRPVGRHHHGFVVELAGHAIRPPASSTASANSGPRSKSSGRIIEFDALSQRLGEARGLRRPAAAMDARGAPCLDRRAADPRRAAVRPRPARRARISPRARLGGFRPAAYRGPAGRELARRGAWPGSACRTRSGSRNSTAASPSSSTTSRIWSASCRCSRATPSGTPTIPSSAPTWSRRCAARSAR